MKDHTLLDGSAALDDGDMTLTHGRIADLRTEALRQLVGRTQVLYAIRLKGGRIKIGCTGDINTRRRHFGSGTQLLAVAPGDFSDEAAIHRHLQPHVVEGREIYAPHADVLAVVADLRERFVECLDAS